MTIPMGACLCTDLCLVSVVPDFGKPACGMNSMANQSIETARCGCGALELQVSGKPLFRGYCHCTTCQKYTGHEHADITVFRAADVVLADETTVSFKGYQKLPMAKRGKCVICKSPTHEKVSIPVLPNLIIVATQILPVSLIVEPSTHIFYHRRTKNVADGVPRHSGFLKSQAVFMGLLIKSLWRGR